MNEEALKCIFGRRSIRVFVPGDVPEADLKCMLEAAMAAPSAVAKDPWRFVVVRDRAMLGRMAEVLSNGQMLLSAALAVVVCGDLEAAHDRQLSYLLQDCSAAIENFLLAGHALGFGTCWLGIHPREHRIERIRHLLELPGHVVPVAAIAVGRPGEHKEPRTRYRAQYVHREKW